MGSLGNKCSKISSSLRCRRFSLLKFFGLKSARLLLHICFWTLRFDTYIGSFFRLTKTWKKNLPNRNKKQKSWKKVKWDHTIMRGWLTLHPPTPPWLTWSLPRIRFDLQRKSRTLLTKTSNFLLLVELLVERKLSPILIMPSITYKKKQKQSGKLTQKKRQLKVISKKMERTNKIENEQTI